MKRREISVTLAQELDAKEFNPTLIEERVANSTVLVVLLTKNCLKQKEVVFPMTAAYVHYGKVVSRVILVSSPRGDIFTIIILIIISIVGNIEIIFFDIILLRREEG